MPNLRGQLRYFVDETSVNFSNGPRNWTVSRDIRWAGGTQASPAFAENAMDPGAEFTLSFLGTEIAFVGNTPPTTGAAQTFLVTIDNDEPYEATFSDPSPPSYRQWYQSPVLSSTEHVIKVQNIAGGASIDYAIATFAEGALAYGYDVVVDDGDADMEYSGAWTTDHSRFKADGVGNLGGLPLGNGTHRSNTTGDMAKLTFTGESVSLFGVMELTGQMEVSFQIDEQPAVSRTYSVNGSSLAPHRAQPNFEWFGRHGLVPGVHTLTVQVVQCEMQTFSLDYVLYKATFKDAHLRPNATDPASLPSVQSAVGRRLIAGIVCGVLTGFAMVLFIAIYLMRMRPSPSRSGRLRRDENKAHDKAHDDLELQRMDLKDVVLDIRGHSPSPPPHWRAAEGASPEIPPPPQTITPFLLLAPTCPPPSAAAVCPPPAVVSGNSAELKRHHARLEQLLRDGSEAEAGAGLRPRRRSAAQLHTTPRPPDPDACHSHPPPARYDACGSGLTGRSRMCPQVDGEVAERERDGGQASAIVELCRVIQDLAEQNARLAVCVLGGRDLAEDGPPPYLELQ